MSVQHDKRAAEFYIAYKITNLVTGAAYIGITSKTKRHRWARHLRAALKENCQTAIGRAIRKYGSENFAITEVAEAYSFLEACALEKGLIAEHGTWCGAGGYNLTGGGDGFGVALSKERRALISQQVRRRIAEGWVSATSEERSAAMLAAHAADPTIAKRISEKRKGMKFSKDHRQKLSVAFREVWTRPGYKELHQAKLIASRVGTYVGRVGKQGKDEVDKRVVAITAAKRRCYELETGVVVDAPLVGHCFRGHPLSGDNVRRRADGRRGCRKCIRVANKEACRKRRKVAAMQNDSHLPKGGSKVEAGALNQHKRLALGEKVSGTTNPNGTERGPTEKKVGNALCTY